MESCTQGPVHFVKRPPIFSSTQQRIIIEIDSSMQYLLSRRQHCFSKCDDNKRKQNLPVSYFNLDERRELLTNLSYSFYIQVEAVQIKIFWEKTNAVMELCLKADVQAAHSISSIPSTQIVIYFFKSYNISIVSIYQNSKSFLVVYMHSKTEHESQKTNSFLTCYGALKECVASVCLKKKMYSTCISNTFWHAKCQLKLLCDCYAQLFKKSSKIPLLINTFNFNLHFNLQKTMQLHNVIKKQQRHHFLDF